MDKQYAGLKELAEDRRKKLDHTYHHFLLSREVEELEQWIAERDVVASSQEMGQDLDHVTVDYTHTYTHTPALLTAFNSTKQLFIGFYYPTASFFVHHLKKICIYELPSWSLVIRLKAAPVCVEFLQ